MIVFPLVIVAAVALTFAFFASGRLRRHVLGFEDPGRIRPLAMAILAWSAGMVLFNQLTFDDNDNAYLLLALLGLVMVPVGLAFFVESALPTGPWRRWGVLVALGIFWAVGILCAASLMWALVVIPSQQYPDNDVFVAHLLGLFVIVGLLGMALLLFRPIPLR